MVKHVMFSANVLPIQLSKRRKRKKKGRRKESTPAERARIEDHINEENFCMSSVGLTREDFVSCMQMSSL